MEREADFIYGRNPVREALKAKRVKMIYLTDSMTDKVILEEIKLQKIESKVVTNNELTNKFKENKHQGTVKQGESFKTGIALHEGVFTQRLHVDGVRDGRLWSDDKVGLCIEVRLRHIENPLNLLRVGETVLLHPGVGVLLHNDRLYRSGFVDLPLNQRTHE